ncbi:MAG: hypothetical protein K8R58_07340, partial [Bacteroidales bacterium]|nr:hypothetical protein [Bacteroidales bacterium]
MKKIYILLIILSVLTEVYGQNNIVNETGVSFTFEEELDGDTIYEYTASDYIKMNDGFEYTPNSGNYFHAKTDPFMVFPPGGGVAGGPNPADSGVVGTIPGNFSVSSTGAATYTIPIDLPAGTAGMTPDLALVYNSRARNNIMGSGWSISGFSSITRTHPTYYYNGAPDDIDFINDQLLLDGKRLIRVDSIDGKIFYKTEIHDISKIIYYADNPPNDYFEVKTKSGLTKIYGQNTDSRQVYSPNINQADDKYPFIWHLDRIIDRQNNYIDYTYLQQPNIGDVKLIGIEYTGKKVSDKDNNKSYGYYKIQFFFNSFIIEDEQELIQTNYFNYRNSGNYIYNNIYKLNNIVIVYDDEEIKKYGFLYTINNITDEYYLREITLTEKISGNEENVNSTKFNWHFYDYDYEIENYDTTKAVYFGAYRIGTGDFNGDGKSDIAETMDVDTLRIFSPSDNSMNIIISCLKPEIVSGADFNGDGKDEIVLIYDDKITIYKIFTASKNNLYDYELIFTTSGKPVIGDFNGDGLMDCVVASDAQTWTYFEGNPDSYLGNGIAAGQFTGTLDDEKFRVADFDGNGTSEIVGKFTDINNYHIFKFNFNNSHFEFFGSFSQLYPCSKLFLKDFNSDGKSDICELGSGKKAIRFSMGSSFTEVFENDFSNQINSVMDMNNDGRDDFLSIYYNEITKKIKIFSYFTKPDGKAWNSKFLEFDLEGNYDDLNILGCISNDFSGNGIPDVYVKFVDPGHPPYQADKFYSWLITHNDQFVNTIDTITNGFGAKININYSPLIPASSCFTCSATPSYPLGNLISGNLYIVNEATSSNGQGGFFHTQYFYEGAKIHAKGKGFLCFEKFYQKNFKTGFLTINYYSIDNINYYFPKLDSINKFIIGQQVPFFEKHNRFQFKPYSSEPSNLIFFPFVETSITKERENNGNYIRTTKSISNYDEYGNKIYKKNYIDKDELDFSSPVNLFDFWTETIIDYYEDDPVNYQHFINNWVLGLIRSVDIVKYSPDGEKERYTEFSYFQDTASIQYGLLETKTIEPQHDSAKIFEYEYDNYGNIKSKTLRALNNPDLIPRITLYEYDHELDNPHGRFLTKITEKTDGEDDHITTSQYNYKTGLINSVTDINGLTTSYFYDNFGRLIKTISPDNVQSHNAFRWLLPDDTDKPPNALYYEWIQSSGSPPVKVYYDTIGRVLRTVTIGFNKNEKIYSDKVYDENKGLLVKESDPFFHETLPQDIQWTEYYYDDMNRIWKTVLPSKPDEERKTEITYNGLEIITKNAKEQTQTVRKYATGWLKESEDTQGNIMNYSYYANGLLKEMEDLKGNITSFEYDLFENRTKIIDPDVGVVIDIFNAYNELNKEVKNGEIVADNIIYDRLGRIISNTIPEGTTVWEYDTKQHGFGKISTITLDYIDCNQDTIYHTKFFEYDSLSRLISITETINEEPFTTTNTYDIFSRIKCFEYPSGYKIKYKYNSQGYLSKINDESGSMLWEATAYNAKNQLTDYNLGNGINTQNIYNPFTGMINNIIANKNSLIIQNMNYQWDVLGNLSEREDENKFLKETFRYDNLNRLYQIELNGNLVSEIDFNEIGNITDKTGVGNYTYDETSGIRPHAVKNITGDLNGINQTDQQIDYTSFDKVCRIIEDTDTLDMIYGIGHSRIKQKIHSGNSFKIKTYIGGVYEKIQDENGNIKEIHYISAPNGVVGIYNITNSANKEMNYILKDHLGSIQCITDGQGNLVEELSFDAWGRRRNPTDWSYNNIPASFMFDRGFTMHEHLDKFGLINMNGRMYDPAIGRFLSPDPFTQTPHSLQGLNRYSYLMNNPLSGIDPTGYFIKANKDIGTQNNSIGIGSVAWDYFTWYPGQFEMIELSINYRAAKYSAPSYEKLKKIKSQVINFDNGPGVFNPSGTYYDKIYDLGAETTGLDFFFEDKPKTVKKKETKEVKDAQSTGKPDNYVEKYEEYELKVNYGLGFGVKSPYGSGMVNVWNKNVYTLSSDKNKKIDSGFLIVGGSFSVPLINAGGSLN